MNQDFETNPLAEVTKRENAEWCSYSGYKAGPFPDAPPIPDHWKNLPNLVLFDERNERGYDDLPVYSVTQDRGVVLQESLEYSVANASKDRSNYKLIRQGDLVYNKMRMWQGAVGRASAQGVVSPAYVVLEPKENVDARFFAYFYRSSAGLVQSNRLSYGIVDDQNSLRASDFLGGRSPVPPPQEQVAISDYLDSMTAQIDRLIDKKMRLIELLQERRTALITKAVTKGLDPDVPMKDSGEEWLGEIPKHWEQVKLGRLITEIEQGWSPVSGNRRTGPDEWGVITLSAISQGKFFPEEHKRLPRDVEGRSEIEIEKGDLLLTRANTPDLVGDACLVRSTPPKLMFSDLVYRLNLNENVIEKDFALQFLLSKAGRYQISRDCRGSSRSMAKIAQGHIKNWVMTLPPLAEQVQIVNELQRGIDHLRRTRERLRDSIGAFEQYRSALITAAVTGKIDVRDQAA